MRRRRFVYLCVADLLAWVGAFAAFTVVRYMVAGWDIQTALEVPVWTSVTLMGLGAGLLHIALGVRVRLHHGRSSIGSVEELLTLGCVAGVVGIISTGANLLFTSPVPGTVPLSASLLALVVMAAYRLSYRAQLDQIPPSQRRGPDGAGGAPTIVMGAGDAGIKLVRSMLRDPAGPFRPVAFLDDDRGRRHRQVRHVQVLGGRDALGNVAARFGATVLVIAIPSADSNTIRSLSQPALDLGLEVKVLPGPADLVEPGKPAVRDVRGIDVTDLLGRHQIDTDIASIAGYLRGKRVLVTGAGGSIGSELCRQIAKFEPGELIMLDRDESALHAVQLSIYGRALLDSNDVVLGDIRDSLFIDALFEDRKPHVVFHAAALKHLPMLEQYPGEAVKTNVWGTLSILEAAKAHDVERFVNISTDKAANPCSVLGYSKRLAEGLTASIAKEAAGTYLSVRFGNVLGSRGSVLTSFASQIEKGGPVTVTDPEVTRFFMTVQEAVQLVIQAAAIGTDGEALVLDMGKPVSIKGVAQQMIDLAGGDIDIVYTGLRVGEKMHEELWGDGETDLRPTHPLVSHTPVPTFKPLEARELDPWTRPDRVLEAFGTAVARMSASPGGTQSAASLPRQYRHAEERAHA